MVNFLLIAVLCVSMILGIPIAFSLGLPSWIALVGRGGIPTAILGQRIVAGVNNFPLLAIPFFLLAAQLMMGGGLTDRLIKMFNVLFGPIRGGLALTNVGVSMFFAGISGSAVADTSSIGAILIPAMKKEGYDPGFSVAITSMSSLCGPMIPPSIPLIIYGIVAGVSIKDLFLGGAVPGAMLGFVLMLSAYLVCKKRGYYGRGKRASFGEVLKTFKDSGWALVMPVIIVGGIVSGVFTPTECSAVAVVYGFLVGKFVYRHLRISALPKILLDTAVTTSVVLFIIAMSTMYSWLLSTQHIPRLITDLVLGVTSNPILLLLGMNLILLATGMFLDSTPATIILVPIFLPIIQHIGMSPVHFGVVMVFNLMLGLITPPVCVCLALASEIAGIRIEKAFWATLPYFVLGIGVLMLITYFPLVVMTLPNLLG